MPRAASNPIAGRLRGPAGRAGSARGFVLSQCRPEAALPWARRGLGPVLVGTLDGWTVVAPDGPPRARFPYDDAVRTLAGRPVGLRMRPALGFFQVGRQAVVTVHPQQWRAVERWAVWTPRDAAVVTPGLPTARPEDLVAAAGLTGSAALAAGAGLHDLWADGGRDAAGILTATLLELGLPGGDLVTGAARAGELDGVRRIVPKDRHARAFDKLVQEEERYRLEEEGS